ncbi:MAG: putative oxidoreductase [Bradyrhizobium sp.]|nr:putative oxidoreductase [Bradyrhizobium sp.]
MGLIYSFPIKEARYCDSKGAIITRISELALQWARRGERVSCIAPEGFPGELADDKPRDDASIRGLERNAPKQSAPFVATTGRHSAPARRSC